MELIESGPATAAPEPERNPSLPTELPSDPTVADLVRLSVAVQVENLRAHEQGVRAGADPDQVRKTRVAVRRLRSNLRTFDSYLDRSAIRPVVEELRVLATELGGLRDREVLAGRIRDRSRLLAPDDRRLAAELVVMLEAEIVVAREVVIRFLDSERYAALLVMLAELAANPPVTDAAAQAAADAAGPVARRPWRRLRKAVRELPKNPSDSELHQVRILAKRSRYAAQAVAPIAGEPAAEFAKAVAEVQTILGEHQDAVTTEAWLKAVPADGGKTFVAGELAGLERAAALEARARWPDAWKAVDRPEMRAWMEAKPASS